MRVFIIRRLLLLIPVLLGITMFVFALTRLGGDPAAIYFNPHMGAEAREHVREALHLNENVLTQYWYWLVEIVQGNWGYSPTGATSVTESIIMFFPATFELAMVALFIALPSGIYLGTLSAVKRGRGVDHGTRIMALVGVSLPIFVLGLVLQYVFYFKLQLLPATGRYDEILFFDYQRGFHNYTGFFIIDTAMNLNWTMFVDGVRHLILPAITLSFGSIALIARLMRSSMLEVLGLDYVKTARAKGLPERVVIKKHARRNALIPVTTVGGLMFGGMLGGAVITETIFAWPGLGRWATQAITTFDTGAIMGFVLITSIIYVLSNLVVDILYAYLDPRVKLE